MWYIVSRHTYFPYILLSTSIYIDVILCERIYNNNTEISPYPNYHRLFTMIWSSFNCEHKYDPNLDYYLLNTDLFYFLFFNYTVREKDVKVPLHSITWHDTTCIKKKQTAKHKPSELPIFDGWDPFAHSPPSLLLSILSSTTKSIHCHLAYLIKWEEQQIHICTYIRN